ncbi:MAG: DUF2284 domain-containing protein [Lachnospiraceae bacterium]|nr:DUF2284 domain-containing protein [Lachnospiraceae bacterium]
MTHAEIEEFITQFPLYQYAFLTPGEIEYDEKTRLFCKHECPGYGSSWSCPPAIGKIAQCKDRCLQYTDALVFTSVTRVTDISNPTEKAKIQVTHEKMTRIIEDFMKENGLLIYTLSSGSCSVCTKCGFPKEKCRHPGDMHPCIESHGIVAADLAEYCNMDYYMGENLLLRFSIIFFRQ